MDTTEPWANIGSASGHHRTLLCRKPIAIQNKDIFTLQKFGQVLTTCMSRISYQHHKSTSLIPPFAAGPRALRFLSTRKTTTAPPACMCTCQCGVIRCVRACLHARLHVCQCIMLAANVHLCNLLDAGRDDGTDSKCKTTCRLYPDIISALFGHN